MNPELLIKVSSLQPVSGGSGSNQSLGDNSNLTIAQRLLRFAARNNITDQNAVEWAALFEIAANESMAELFLTFDENIRLNVLKQMCQKIQPRHNINASGQ